MSVVKSITLLLNLLRYKATNIRTGRISVGSRRLNLLDNLLKRIRIGWTWRFWWTGYDSKTENKTGMVSMEGKKGDKKDEY